MFQKMQENRNENLAITKRREQENHFQHFEGLRENHNYTAHRVDWENQSQAMIERNAIANIARGMEAGQTEELQARRAKLADLYRQDEEQQKRALASLRETSTQRAKRMVVHARKLKSDRKAKAQAFAQEMYNRQWREGCDDLRLIESESFARHCRQEIGMQRQEKQQRKAHESREEGNWAAMWEEERLKRVEAEDEQKRRRQRFNRETKVALLDQMETTRNSKLEEAYQQELEREAIQRQREEDENFAKQKQDQFARERRSAMNDIVAFNVNTQKSKADVSAKQKEQELNDLMQKLELEKADDMKKAQEKEHMRKDMKEYMAYLKQRKAEEKEMERRIEILSQEEQDRTDYKRDVQWEKEAVARQNLLDEVYRGRAKQLEEMADRRVLEAEDLQVEKLVIAEEVIRSQELEQREEDAIRFAKHRNQSDLVRQMQSNSNTRKMAGALVAEERENAIEADRQYRSFVVREKSAAARRNQEMFGASS